MGGGIILLTVMLHFFDPIIAIPLHGVVQLVSNSSRTIVQRKHVRWDFVGRFAVLLFPAAFLGLLVTQSIPPHGGKVIIGVFALSATWFPQLLFFGMDPKSSHPTQRFFWLGGIAGLLQTTVGAVGPLIAPFFLNIGLERQAIVGSKAACQLFGHASKIIVFLTFGALGFLGFRFRDYALALVLLCATVIVGTWLGSHLLDRVNEIWFKRLFRGALTIVAARLILWDGYALLQSAF